MVNEDHERRCVSEGPAFGFRSCGKATRIVALRLVAINNHEAVSHDEEPLLHFYITFEISGLERLGRRLPLASLATEAVLSLCWLIFY